MDQVKFFKGYLPQILFVSFFNTLCFSTIQATFVRDVLIPHMFVLNFWKVKL